MPCKCLGISKNACNCNKLSTLQSYLRDSNDLNITFGTSNGTAKMTKNQCFLEYLGLNSFYDMCATYNLKYCGYRYSYLMKRNRFKQLVKDCIILIFFLMANLVVFITLLSRMAYEMVIIATQSVAWTQSKLKVHRDEIRSETCLESH
ncbi:uncharacterized protein LOC126978376 [Leptidea sinapis]|uniref:uncharacterized protein LOC126978376 n=1 Tax=Leptidea sinapis TaxID=189913 RepID=UPI0021286F79|nr:uncharacterized protein LOC126978376 [Leptidea sinapis]